MAALMSQPIRWAVKQRAKQGESICGDAYWAGRTPTGVLIAVVDGLGSGQAAAEVARTALAVVAQYQAAALVDILQRCHMALVESRGVVMGLLRIDLERRRVQYAGIGNIECRAISASNFAPFSAYGIVGHRLPTMRQFEADYQAGDLFVLYTDGVNRDFDLKDVRMTGADDLHTLVEAIVADHSHPEDDVLVLAVR
jgi:negative regulator of sigma-B (phosphoserine phosphatase)